MSRIGPTELILILAIVVLLFGSTRLPKLAKGLGESIKEFRKARNEGAKPTDDEPKKDA